ncbi:MAG: DUF1553 domain-containing protein, partial [Bacteroidota bacterium]
LCFDLPGRPPREQFVRNYLNDSSPEAYEKQVDRLLASTDYGERMAMEWMDVARFADTHGYSVDRYRDMSPYRDWVIQAFNENMGYDEFIHWQLAGDLFPNPTKDQLIATAFNRIHPQNMEGGIVQEEFRVEYVADRANTVGTAFMALTYGCARCHDHKYDPISQKDYFEMFSFFNNVNEAGQISWDDVMPVPTVLLTDDHKDSVLHYLKNEVYKAETTLTAHKTKNQQQVDRWIDQERYKNHVTTPISGRKGVVTFDRKTLVNNLTGTSYHMARQGSKKEVPEYEKRSNGWGLKLNGDTWLDLGEDGIFNRDEPFTIGLQLKLPENLTDGVIFHKGKGAALYNLRGYHLALKDGRLQLLMAHNYPDNAIVEYGKTGKIPTNEWIHLGITYDGSSTADGYKLFMNGEELETEVEIDNLYQGILFPTIKKEPGLQIGARWRGKGIKGAVVDDITYFDRELSSLELGRLGSAEKLQAIVKKSPETLNKQERKLLEDFYWLSVDPTLKKERTSVRIARAVLNDTIANVPEVMVMKEMPERRRSYILERGEYDAHGEEVFPNVPSNILPMDPDLPKNRLGLAKWLTDPRHPLTARVAVNRYWQLYFGRGLVKTSEDFGNQGELPSHPELLDWLAVWFVEHDWDVKALQKLIVTSATYKRSSMHREDLMEIDAENMWLAKGPSGRLPGEMIRDNVLAASGLLIKKVGGKSVKPYQPKGLWRVNGMTYERDQGDNLYRKSLYTFWKRSVNNPTIGTFDAPLRTECIIRRQETNTPLQALVLLNDPTFLEAARVMAADMINYKDTAKAIESTFIKLTGRFPTREEFDLLASLREEQFELFKENPEKADGVLQIGETPIEDVLDKSTLAANTILVNAIMNLDATISKR